jgi:Fur family transcriptional regulator, ferric uptake regulator
MKSTRRPRLLSFAIGGAGVGPMASSPSERYAEFLASKGRWLTTQTSRVVDVVFSASGTFDSEDIVASMRGEASRATVYRVVAGLVDAELLRRVRFNDRDVFVATAEPDPSA